MLKFLVAVLAFSISTSLLAGAKFSRFELLTSQNLGGTVSLGIKTKNFWGSVKSSIDLSSATNPGMDFEKKIDLMRATFAIRFDTFNNLPASENSRNVSLLGKIRNGKIKKMFAMLGGDEPLDGKSAKKIKETI